ncbi:MAG: 2Fe-2S iron-sulfur cluster-binding protein [Methylococcales bacterium]|nr:2Fe-2S iron-sulfur cluster-binding protein [Methylococcales bacterium]
MSQIIITLNDREIVCQEGDSVLDALLRAGINIPFSCRQGNCQSCMIRSLRGVPPSAAQTGLKDAQLHQHHFLACLCYPQQSMTVSLTPAEAFFTEARVIGKTLLNAETMLLSLQCWEALTYYAGQFVNLMREDGLVRSYCIANSRDDGYQLNFHIRRLADGRFSQWVHQELAVGDTLAISEPRGLCYYLPGNPQQNILLVGTGSGLAPLAGIVGDALRHDHQGSIHLYHGSREMDGLYWIDEMRTLARRHANFHYTPCVSRGDAPHTVAKGRANEVAMSTLPSLRDWRIYLSGHPDMVNQARRQAFLKGAAFPDMYVDAFHVASSTLD